MKIGISLLWESPLFRKLLLPALMIFLIFYKLIFSPLVKKHHQRIMRMSIAKMAWYNFFDCKSYLIMICMMTLGVLIRKLQLVPEWNIAFFIQDLDEPYSHVESDLLFVSSPKVSESSSSIRSEASNFSGKEKTNCKGQIPALVSVSQERI